MQCSDSSALCFAELLSICTRFGETDVAYLEFHFQRFRETLTQLEQVQRDSRGRQLLDIGAHWLHQAVMFTAAGYEVTATDVPAVLRHQGLAELAGDQGIALVPTDDLKHPTQCWEHLGDDAFDVIVLGEVLEHLAFNPRVFWREIQRLLRPGGVLLVSTPNAYAIRSVLRGAWRFLRGDGWGVPVDEIATYPTYTHHWKEYSARELRRYCELLIPALRVERLLTLPNLYPGQSRYSAVLDGLEHLVPPLRSHLFLLLRADGDALSTHAS